MTHKQFPHDIRYICDDHLEEKFRQECKGNVLVGAKGWCLPSEYVPVKEKLFNFEVKADDIWIMGYPRSGTTVTQEMLWLIANDLDFKTALEVPNPYRILFFERHLFMSGNVIINNTVTANTVAKEIWHKIIHKKKRRFFKTHLSFDLLPRNLLEVGAKVIYVARNPKDVITSSYNFNDLMRRDGYKFTFKDHCELFMQGRHVFCPYLEHVKDAWDLRQDKNLLFFFYEDILKDKRGAMTKMAKFLGKTLSERNIEDLTVHLDIENFRNNNSLNYIQLRHFVKTNKNREHDFIRKGIIGDWKNYADPELDKIVTQWIEDGIGDCGIPFKYE